MFWGYLFALAFVRDDPMWLVVKLLKVGGLQVIVLDQCWECFPIHQHPWNKWNEIRSRMVDYYNRCSKKYLSELWRLDSIWFNQAVGYRCTKLLLSIVICNCWLYWPPETFWQSGKVLSAVKTVKILAGVLGFLVRWCVSEEWRGLKEVGVEQDFDQLKSDMSSGVYEFVCWRLYTIIMIIIRIIYHISGSIKFRLL